jgi:hypothetical protein
MSNIDTLAINPFHKANPFKLSNNYMAKEDIRNRTNSTIDDNKYQCMKKKLDNSQWSFHEDNVTKSKTYLIDAYESKYQQS